MRNYKTKILILSLLLIIVATTGFRCKWMPTEVREAMQPVTLNYWRVWDDSSAFNDIVSTYKAKHPQVNINYRRLRYEEFEQALLEALAEDKGPDIISLHNTWLREYQTKLLPMPAQTTMPYSSVESHLGGLKKEEVIKLRTTNSITPAQIKQNFIEVVYKDVVINDQIYGLPLAVDTLVLFYNRDMLDNENIVAPPETWEDLQKQVKILTKQDANGEIVQAGAALGTSNNITRSTDILSILMLQNGTEMTSGNRITFNTIPSKLSDRSTAPGEEALRFYTDFANPAKEVYTWHQKMPDSLESFISGKVAFFLGYSYHLKQIEVQSPKIDLGIAKLPQISVNQKVNYANYWVETVSVKTKHPNEAWDFLQFAATSKEHITSYLDQTDKPTALRGLIEQQLQDETIAPFAEQLLTAISWYHGKDAENMEKFLAEMIETVVSGEKTPTEAINTAAQQINQTMY